MKDYSFVESVPHKVFAISATITPGQSHLIFGLGSTGCVTTSRLSKLSRANTLYKPLENLDAFALDCHTCLIAADNGTCYDTGVRSAGFHSSVSIDERLKGSSSYG